jgi:CBS domain-containing protein
MMRSLDDHSLGNPLLADAIDRNPLIVEPDTPLSTVVLMMHSLASSAAPQPPTPERPAPERPAPEPLLGARSSCVLVMQADELLGIFTERDLVQLIALGHPLANTKIRDVMHHPVITMSEAALQNVFAALFLFRRHRIRHLAIAEGPNLVGVISLDSIRHILRPTNLLKVRRVAEVMTTQVITALPDTPVMELINLMAIHCISCIVIVEPSQEAAYCRPVGIVTERDIVHFQAMQLDLHCTAAKTVMSTPLFVLNPEDSLWTAHQEMERRRVRRLVVSWNWGQSLGIVTQTSILRVFDPIEMHGVIEMLQRTIHQLGFDVEQVLARAIDHDAHLPAPACALHEVEPLPNVKLFLSQLQTQLESLVTHRDLPAHLRQAALSQLLLDLQSFQHRL